MCWTECESFRIPLAATFACIGYLALARRQAADRRHHVLVALTAIATSTIGRPAVLVGGGLGIAVAVVFCVLLERRR